MMKTRKMKTTVSKITWSTPCAAHDCSRAARYRGIGFYCDGEPVFLCTIHQHRFTRNAVRAGYTTPQWIDLLERDGVI